MIKGYQDGKTALKFLITTLFVCLLVGYSIFQVHKLATGPVIDVELPKQAVITGSGMLKLQGVASNIAFITVNDSPIYIDEKGLFSVNLLLYPGYNVIKLYGRDKFGKTLTRLVEVTYKQ
jgi:hypothetical protein